MRFAISLHRFVLRSGLAIAIGMVIAGSAAASDWYVDFNAPSGGNGSQAHPFQHINDALTSSSDGDRILVSPAVYKEVLSIQTSVSILGQPGGTTIISDLNVTASALTISSGKSVWLQDLTITGTVYSGGAYPYGGGINNSGTTVAVRCHITGCSAINAGGIYNAGTMVMWDCVVDQCSATTGGGLYNAGTLKLFNCTVSKNSAVDDLAEAIGGGIFSSSSSSPDVSVLRIVNSTISGNSAKSGFFLLFSGIAFGGGMYASGTAWIDHSTIADNDAKTLAGGTAYGGGFMNRGIEAGVTHSVFAGNSVDGFPGPDFDGVCDSHGYLLIEDASSTTLQGDMTGVQTGVAARLLPLADNGGFVPTQALDPTSPCIDAGNPDPLASPAYDARGYPRALWDPSAGPSDLGAYEYGSTPSFLLTATPDLPLSAGSTVALTTGGGIYTHPNLLVLVDVNGAPTFAPLLFNTFDQSGVIVIEGSVPNGLSGTTAGLKSFSIDVNGKLEISNEALLTFQ